MKCQLGILSYTALVESVLLYGSETWTMTKRLEKMVDGCYTRMLKDDVNEFFTFGKDFLCVLR